MKAEPLTIRQFILNLKAHLDYIDQFGGKIEISRKNKIYVIYFKKIVDMGRNQTKNLSISKKL
jgi:hypothetical protein